MLSRLLLLFIVVPAVELILLIQMGRWIGTIPTVGLIVLTGIVGAYLARQQGLQVLRRIQQQTSQGQLPGQALMDGAMILVAGAVLMTPGVLTDALGFLLLIPQSRALLRTFASAQVQRMIDRGQIRVSGFGNFGGFGQMNNVNMGQKKPDVIIIDPEELEQGSRQ